MYAENRFPEVCLGFPFLFLDLASLINCIALDGYDTSDEGNIPRQGCGQGSVLESGKETRNEATEIVGAGCRWA